MVWQALGAIGSLLAVVVAVGIAVVDYKTHGAALNREREHREARESVESARLHREQAERVSAYVEVPLPPDVGLATRTDGVPTLHNGSDLRVEPRRSISPLPPVRIPHDHPLFSQPVVHGAGVDAKFGANHGQ